MTVSDIPKSNWNLIDGSADFKNISNNTYSGSISDKKTPYGNSSFRKDDAWNYPSLSADVVEGKTYTFSYSLLVTKNVNGFFKMYDSDTLKILDNGFVSLNDVPANTWIKAQCSFIPIKNMTMQISLSSNKAVTCYVGDYMLNEGSIALDWNYSLNDLKSKSIYATSLSR